MKTSISTKVRLPTVKIPTVKKPSFGLPSMPKMTGFINPLRLKK